MLNRAESALSAARASTARPSAAASSLRPLHAYAHAAGSGASASASGQAGAGSGSGSGTPAGGAAAASHPLRKATPFHALLQSKSKDLSGIDSSFLSSLDAETKLELAVADSVRMARDEEAEREAATAALEVAIAPIGLQTLADNIVPRNGHCLMVSVEWALKASGRDVPGDVKALRALVGAELLGPRRDHWQSYDSANLSGKQYAEMVTSWMATGNWRSSMLPTALAAIPDTFELLVVLIRTCKVQPLVVLAPQHGGIRSVLFLGHEVSSRPHFRPLTQSEDSRKLTFALNDMVLQSVLLRAVGSTNSEQVSCRDGSCGW